MQAGPQSPSLHENERVFVFFAQLEFFLTLPYKKVLLQFGMLCDEYLPAFDKLGIRDVLVNLPCVPANVVDSC